MKTGIATTFPLHYVCWYPFLPPRCGFLLMSISSGTDGKKVSSSLRGGGNSIELDNGPHQLVFRVEKTIHLSNSEELLYLHPGG
ncbi:DUF2057 family protein [Escherichia coli]